MDKFEAYKLLHSQSPIEVGDTVRILRRFEIGEMGCPIGFSNGAMEKFIGLEGKVVRNDYDVFSVIAEGHDSPWNWPFFCLELIEKAKKEEEDPQCVKDAAEMLRFSLEMTFEELTQEVANLKKRALAEEVTFNDFLFSKAMILARLVDNLPFSDNTCPFCLQNTNENGIRKCAACNYGKEKKICTDNNSSFRKILDKQHDLSEAIRSDYPINTEEDDD